MNKLRLKCFLYCFDEPYQHKKYFYLYSKLSELLNKIAFDLNLLEYFQAFEVEEIWPYGRSGKHNLYNLLDDFLHKVPISFNAEVLGNSWPLQHGPTQFESYWPLFRRPEQRLKTGDILIAFHWPGRSFERIHASSTIHSYIVHQERVRKSWSSSIVYSELSWVLWRIPVDSKYSRYLSRKYDLSWVLWRLPRWPVIGVLSLRLWSPFDMSSRKVDIWNILYVT